MPKPDRLEEFGKHQYDLGYQRGKIDGEAELGKVVDSLIEMQSELKQHLGKRLPIVKEGETTDFSALVRIHHRLISLIGL